MGPVAEQPPVGCSVWYENAEAGTEEVDEPFQRGTVVAHTEDSELVIRPDAGGKPLRFAATAIWRASAQAKNAEASTGVPDCAQMEWLNEPSLIDNLSRRFHSDEIYTYVGRTLLAINPYRPIAGLYDLSNMERYRGKAMGLLPPHVYAVADRARRMLISEGSSQSIVVSGEVRWSLFRFFFLRSH
eukprot:6194211-Pleurochrysis_carterae.AAC.2